jgi:hypothetical protein
VRCYKDNLASMNSTATPCEYQFTHTQLTMHISILAFAGLAAASPALIVRNNGRPDLSRSYWDATIASQSGRPGYSIRDLSASFHSPKLAQTVNAKCHYSFVPQGTSPPAETDTCDPGLQYTWDCTSSLVLNVLLSYSPSHCSAP